MTPREALAVLAMVAAMLGGCGVLAATPDLSDAVADPTGRHHLHPAGTVHPHVPAGCTEAAVTDTTTGRTWCVPWSAVDPAYAPPGATGPGTV